MTERVTLKPGDYVSTEGMTEEAYHAVARAFMAAGAESGEYPEPDYIADDMGETWAFGSRDGTLWHGRAACFKGRHLTPAQVIGAVNAGNQQEEDNMEHKAGDRFIATKDSRFFSEGSTVRSTGEYGCLGNPKMELVSGECSLNNGPGGTPGAIEHFDRFRKVDHEEKQDMLTALLEAAETARENADQHQMLADQASGEHDRLMQQASDMLPDGWRLVRAEDMVQTVTEDPRDWIKGSIAPTQDMSDPANWREGDVVECTRTMASSTEGRLYELQDRGEGVIDSDGDAVIKSDDDGDEEWLPRGTFRFHSRPTT